MLEKEFSKNGIAKIPLYSPREIVQLRSFLKEWITSNFAKQGLAQELPRDLSTYHKWASANEIPHERLFSAPFRFCSPPEPIKEILLNEKVLRIFRRLSLGNLNLIDEGMGWLGFRIIRPGMNDGYPLSCKDWGASKGAYSFWIPLYGFGSNYALHYVNGSQISNFQNFLPTEGKFTKDEFRLHPDEKVKIESQFVAPGSALFFHPKLIHTEDVSAGRKTRLNLEFRFHAEEI